VLVKPRADGSQSGSDRALQ